MKNKSSQRDAAPEFDSTKCHPGDKVCNSLSWVVLNLCLSSGDVVGINDEMVGRSIVFPLLLLVLSALGLCFVCFLLPPRVRTYIPRRELCTPPPPEESQRLYNKSSSVVVVVPYANNSPVSWRFLEKSPTCCFILSRRRAWCGRWSIAVPRSVISCVEMPEKRRNGKCQTTAMTIKNKFGPPEECLFVVTLVLVRRYSRSSFHSLQCQGEQCVGGVHLLRAPDHDTSGGSLRAGQKNSQVKQTNRSRRRRRRLLGEIPTKCYFDWPPPTTMIRNSRFSIDSGQLFSPEAVNHPRAVTQAANFSGDY